MPLREGWSPSDLCLRHLPQVCASQSDAGMEEEESKMRQTILFVTAGAIAMIAFGYCCWIADAARRQERKAMRRAAFQAEAREWAYTVYPQQMTSQGTLFTVQGSGTWVNTSGGPIGAKITIGFGSGSVVAGSVTSSGWSDYSSTSAGILKFEFTYKLNQLGSSGQVIVSGNVYLINNPSSTSPTTVTFPVYAVQSVNTTVAQTLQPAITLYYAGSPGQSTFTLTEWNVSQSHAEFEAKER
jgi:hypothetical protein